MIVDNVVKRATKAASEEGLILKDYGVAFPYTYVVVEGPSGISMGVSLTMPEEFGDREFREVPHIPSWDLSGLISGLATDHLVARALGLAAANAVSQYVLKGVEMRRMNAADVVIDALEKGAKVAIIGYMKDTMRRLMEAGLEVMVFERNPTLRREGALPDFLEPRYLRDADAAVITGVALLNDTLDIILEYLKPSAWPVILSGPTAQIHPEFLGAETVSHVGSILIRDVEDAVRWLRRGSSRGMKKFSEEYVYP